ncbi:hypothetical protein IA539_06705 [Gordonia sp. zg691]|uniref:Uncharacterized protein n=1 Tax=Gordonia jinghuaiqii TaxID=2758710 RepID=A0A7D7QNF0_9ACTN|nr:hypothetical protein [Gordonia jinghuaiqii]MBD0860900.1 hypothetical protein [Gordonia jinghuaiqii]MCR5979540.1 hypothetical protein [Gordonia jinghuaiqii]QMT00666.1 hypothetical protein H1R19_17475 [Gordonia jinghuaiqii]
MAVLFGPTEHLRQQPAEERHLEIDVIDAGDLQAASAHSRARDGSVSGLPRWPLLRIDTRPAAWLQPSRTAFHLPARPGYLASLVHDARLLGIARGALIVVDEHVDVSRLREHVIEELSERGDYQVRDRLPGWEPVITQSNCGTPLSVAHSVEESPS